MNDEFSTADDAFVCLYNIISNEGIDFAGTKTLFNVGFQIDFPWHNKITVPFREWKEDYAEAEWQWYLSGDPKVEKLGEIYGIVPKIWERMADVETGTVQSNYGWQWEREYQLDKIVAKLKHDPDTRQAVITIYDGKEIRDYHFDTPCTTAIQFSVVNNMLNMCVTMRSNDLWFGFCNDQYCFSELQKLVSERTGYEIGTYFHFAHNIHIYNQQLGKNSFLQKRANYYG
jgi:thymidylate synthase|tara:strand:+ start:1735 stop:2421 length:687 start_codon:yes stop_codon:yes gene_type:complete